MNWRWSTLNLCFLHMCLHSDTLMLAQAHAHTCHVSTHVHLLLECTQHRQHVCHLSPQPRILLRQLQVAFTQLFGRWKVCGAQGPVSITIWAWLALALLLAARLVAGLLGLDMTQGSSDGGMLSPLYQACAHAMAWSAPLAHSFMCARLGKVK